MPSCVRCVNLYWLWLCRKDLPQDLASIIVQKLVELEGLKQAGKLLLVSKAWMTAFSNHPADVVCDGRQSLEALSKALPRMASFKLLRKGERDIPISLQPLQTLTQLTRVKICYSWRRGSRLSNSADVDLRHLPRNVAHLELIYVHLIPQSITAVRFTGLKALTYKGLRNKEDDVWTLLGFLPQLQVCALLSHSSCHPTLHFLLLPTCL